MSEQVCRGVCRSLFWQQAHSVLLYHPLPDEVDVTALLHAAVSAGKQVLLPVVTGPDSIEVRRWTPDTPMQTGAFGIEEPSGEDISREEYLSLIHI